MLELTLVLCLSLYIVVACHVRTDPELMCQSIGSAHHVGTDPALVCRSIEVV